MTDPALERDDALAEIATLEIEVARARAELLAMRQRAYDLAAELEEMSLAQTRPVTRPRRPPAGTPERSSLARLIRAARRPRRTLRILLGRPPD